MYFSKKEVKLNVSILKLKIAIVGPGKKRKKILAEFMSRWHMLWHEVQDLVLLNHVVPFVFEKSNTRDHIA